LIEGSLRAVAEGINDRSLFVIALCLALLLLIEAVKPRTHVEFDRNVAVLTRIGKNGFLWVLGGFVVVPLLVDSWFDAARVLTNPDWGLNLLIQSEVVLLLVGVVVLDLVAFIEHRLAHAFRWYWYIHCVHHSDLTLDATTALRSHPAEALLSALLGVGFAVATGIPSWVIAAHALIYAVVAMWLHSNIAMPVSIDRALRYVLVTPAMHRLHHSPLEQETNSNFGLIFSVWDRLTGSYRNPDAPEATREKFGLTGLSSPNDQSLAGMLRTPLTAARASSQL
jgi:sterol desaturase/sphingolipid hydroxylase (fatty acid hydroxylase superfamily)